MSNVSSQTDFSHSGNVYADTGMWYAVFSCIIGLIAHLGIKIFSTVKNFGLNLCLFRREESTTSLQVLMVGLPDYTVLFVFIVLSEVKETLSTLTFDLELGFHMKNSKRLKSSSCKCFSVMIWDMKCKTSMYINLCTERYELEYFQCWGSSGLEAQQCRHVAF